METGGEPLEHIRVRPRGATPFEQDAEFLKEKDVMEMCSDDMTCYFNNGINGRIRKNVRCWLAEKQQGQTPITRGEVTGTAPSKAIGSGFEEDAIQLPILTRQTTPFEEDLQLLQEKNVLEMYSEDNARYLEPGIKVWIKHSGQFWMGEEEEEEEIEEEEYEYEEEEVQNVESEYVTGAQDLSPSESLDETLRETKTEESPEDYKSEIQSQESAETEGSGKGVEQPKAKGVTDGQQRTDISDGEEGKGKPEEQEEAATPKTVSDEVSDVEKEAEETTEDTSTDTSAQVEGEESSSGESTAVSISDEGEPLIPFSQHHIIHPGQVEEIPEGKKLKDRTHQMETVEDLPQHEKPSKETSDEEETTVEEDETVGKETREKIPVYKSVCCCALLLLLLLLLLLVVIVYTQRKKVGEAR